MIINSSRLIQQQSNEQDANSTRTIDTALDQSHEQRISFHSSIVLPKTIGTNIDRSILRQQPPPMKVKEKKLLKIFHLVRFRRVNRANNKFIAMLPYVRFAKQRVDQEIQRNRNVVTQICRKNNR